MADFYELADTLRILCLASTSITRLIKTQYLLTTSNTGLDDEISEAIRQVNAELRGKTSPFNPDVLALTSSSIPADEGLHSPKISEA